MSLGKWILTGLGWALGGPIGALIGFALGSAFSNNRTQRIDSTYSSSSRGPYHNTGSQDDLLAALLVLVAAVMKSDGSVRQSELNYVKHFLLKNFGEKRAKDMLATLRDIVQRDIPINDVCDQIKINTDYTTRYHLLDFLVGLSVSDAEFSSNEERMLTFIRGRLGINIGDFLSMCERHGCRTQSQYNNTYQNNNEPSHKDPYKVLGLEHSATDEEVKKSYRRFAMKYHPDRVEHLGEEMRKSAEAQFREINEAYELIKQERGIK